jgi:hypothetical protein
MSRDLTFGETLTALTMLTGGATTLAFGILACIQGYSWQTAVFAAGGTYAVRWGWLRLSGRAGR